MSIEESVEEATASEKPSAPGLTSPGPSGVLHGAPSGSSAVGSSKDQEAAPSAVGSMVLAPASALGFLSAEVDVAKAEFKIHCAKEDDVLSFWKMRRAELEDQLKDARIAQEQIAENQLILEESERSAIAAAAVFSDAEKILRARMLEIDAKRMRGIAAINAARDEEVEAVKTELGLLPKATARDAAGVALNQAEQKYQKSLSACADIARLEKTIDKADGKVERCSKARAGLVADLVAKTEKLGKLRQLWKDRARVVVRFRNLVGDVLWRTGDFLAMLRDHIQKFGDGPGDGFPCDDWLYSRFFMKPDSLQVFDYMVVRLQSEKFFKAGEPMPPAFHQSLVMLGPGQEFPLHRTSFADLWIAIEAEHSRMVAEHSGRLGDLHGMVTHDVEAIDLTHVVHAAPAIEFMTQQERAAHPDDAFILDKRTSPPLLKIPSWECLLECCWADDLPNRGLHIYSEDNSGKHSSPSVEEVDVVESWQNRPDWFLREWLARRKSEDGRVDETLFREDEQTGRNILETFLVTNYSGPSAPHLPDCGWWMNTLDPSD